MLTCKKREFHGRRPVLFLGNDKIAEYLIQNGADVNVVGQLNATALILAAEKGNLPINYNLIVFPIC